jgi:uncharacterized protein (DUF433 family)
MLHRSDGGGNPVFTVILCQVFPLVPVPGAKALGFPIRTTRTLRTRMTGHYELAWYNPFMGVITKNPDILGGTPVFLGTRVPIQALFDYLEGGETLEDFLAGFPTVSRESAVAALEEAKHLLLARP